MKRFMLITVALVLLTGCSMMSGGSTQSWDMFDSQQAIAHKNSDLPMIEDLNPTRTLTLDNKTGKFELEYYDSKGEMDSQFVLGAYEEVEYDKIPEVLNLALDKMFEEVYKEMDEESLEAIHAIVDFTPEKVENYFESFGFSEQPKITLYKLTMESQVTGEDIPEIEEGRELYFLTADVYATTNKMKGVTRISHNPVSIMPDVALWVPVKNK